MAIDCLLGIVQHNVCHTIGYSLPLTNLAAQTEFSQPEKDCSS